MKYLRSLALTSALLFAAAFPAQAQWQVPSGSIPVGKGPGNTGFNTVAGSGGAGAKCLLDTSPPTFGACNGAITGAALSRTNDTNVTVTLGGTPSTALLQGVSLTLGWTGTLDYTRGGCNAATQVACRNNIFPTPTRAGDIALWNGSIWTTLAGNNSGTRVLTEDASGNASWSTPGAGTVQSVTCGVGMSGGTFTVTGTCDLNISRLTNSLGADVALNNTANYFDGPSVAQGTTGTWFASGTVTIGVTGGNAQVFCKLWDGTTVVVSAVATALAGGSVSLSLSGYISSPAGNLKISCRDITNTTGTLQFNASGNSKDSTLSVLRVQ